MPDVEGGLKPTIICDFNFGVHCLREVLDRVGFRPSMGGVGLLKSNVCGLYHPDLLLIHRVVEVLLSSVDRVVIGETRSMIHDPATQFDRLGLKCLEDCFKDRVKAVDLSEDELVRVSVPRPHAVQWIDLPKTVIEAEVLVNVAKAGTHITTGLTCALKNLFGLLPQKEKYRVFHPLGVDKVIADIAQVVQPSINIAQVEGKMIVGADPLAVDVLACELMALNPLRIDHLRLTARLRGLELTQFKQDMEVIEI